VVSALAEQHDELARLLADLEESDWARPSPCEGWTVSDVVLHLAQTDEIAIASLAGRFDEALADLTRGLPASASVDEGAGAMVAAQRGEPGPVVRARWEAGARGLVESLDTSDLSARVQWVAGDLAARTLATTRLSEAWIHTGDVATAIDRPLEPTDRLRHIARLAWRTLPYAFAAAGRALQGPVAFELTGPSGDRWDLRTEGEVRTIIRGDALDLCLVAGRRVDPATTSLVGQGPDADAVLELIRTYA
jgi:uncharacterized protein (TIGR03084 family)